MSNYKHFVLHTVSMRMISIGFIAACLAGCSTSTPPPKVSVFKAKELRSCAPPSFEPAVKQARDHTLWLPNEITLWQQFKPEDKSPVQPDLLELADIKSGQCAYGLLAKIPKKVEQSKGQEGYFDHIECFYYSLLKALTLHNSVQQVETLKRKAQYYIETSLEVEDLFKGTGVEIQEGEYDRETVPIFDKNGVKTDDTEEVAIYRGSTLKNCNLKHAWLWMSTMKPVLNLLNTQFFMLLGEHERVKDDVFLLKRLDQFHEALQQCMSQCAEACCYNPDAQLDAKARQAERPANILFCFEKALAPLTTFKQTQLYQPEDQKTVDLCQEYLRQRDQLVGSNMIAVGVLSWVPPHL